MVRPSIGNAANFCKHVKCNSQKHQNQSPATSMNLAPDSQLARNGRITVPKGTTTSSTGSKNCTTIRSLVPPIVRSPARPDLPPCPRSSQDDCAGEKRQ
ncbi:uncharacterized protein MYCGRDRAFT_80752 [Zymoseptoria tritici IPO323]|uniref:Uncharacterized protein n=1 Tax=Zymoseptoria tritici (strain CBS 115943 / IPO323) TaxID=336722 RepID=F9XBP8_ZYMTI|nr:uncharacterized protein MYCGRDRAFT_80752 [Zymoseptoria tritici IPO323]EGP87653.1 hypothetical protein MYCGRDRAFT_80752 [Zymoseptoria tritici IPO323]